MTTKTPIPASPKSMKVNQERLPLALSRIWDHADHTNWPSDGRGDQVFDFDDGLRLILTMERLSCGRVKLHASGSVWPGSLIHAVIEQQKDAWTYALKIFRQRIAELLEVEGDRFKFLAYTLPGFVPHWYADWPEGQP